MEEREETQRAELPGPGWYRDPNGPDTRWWDGAQWTDHVQQGAPTGVDAVNQLAATLATQPREYWFAVLALVGIVIGSFGPWAQNALASESGMDVDGVWFIVGALTAAGSLWAYAKTRARGTLVWPIILGLLVVADSLRVLGEIEDRGQAELFGRSITVAEPGWGIYMTLIAGGAVTILGLILAFRRPPASYS